MSLSKFKELAQAVRDTRRNFDEQADELLTEHEELRRAGEQEFARYREHHAEVRENLQVMREMLSDLQGANHPPGEKKPALPKQEGSGDSSENFQGNIDGEQH